MLDFLFPQKPKKEPETTIDSQLPVKECYSYCDFTAHLDEFINLYNSASNPTESKLLMNLIEHIGSSAVTISFHTAGGFAYTDGKKIMSISTSLALMSKVSAWIKAFGYVGLMDLRINQKYDISSFGEIKTLFLVVDSMSVLRMNKIDDKKMSSYLKNKEKKMARVKIKRLRNLKRIDNLFD